MAPPAPHLADQLLEEIFIHLPTLAALTRASTACASFRRVITARPFLRRLHKPHPPQLLGFVVDKGEFHPAEEPHPSAPLTRALSDGADFSYSFVPKPTSGSRSPWYAHDIHDGRVLLECKHSCDFEFGVRSVDLAVSDPVSRRYVLLPPIPKKLKLQKFDEFEPMLAPIGQNEDEEETSFKVICTAFCRRKLVVFVFSSTTRQWHVAASSTRRSLGTVEPSWKRLHRFNYLRGCFYWTALWCDKLKVLVLDTCIMKFSTVDLPTGLQLVHQNPQIVCMSTIVDGAKGALEMFTLVGDYKACFCVYHITQQNNGESSGEWQHKNVVALPRQCHYYVVSATKGFLFLRGVESAQFHLSRDVNLFSLDVKTFELKKVCRASYFDLPYRVHSYFGFPPSLSNPSL